MTKTGISLRGDVMLLGFRQMTEKKRAMSNDGFGKAFQFEWIMDFKEVAKSDREIIRFPI